MLFDILYMGVDVDAITGRARVQQLAEKEGDVERVGHVCPREHIPHDRKDDCRRSDRHERDDSKDEQVNAVMRLAPGQQDE